MNNKFIVGEIFRHNLIIRYLEKWELPGIQNLPTKRSSAKLRYLVNRYWSITRAMDYLTNRTRTRVIIYIMAVWAFSAFISIPPLLGWKKGSFKYHCVTFPVITWMLLHYAVWCLRWASGPGHVLVHVSEELPAGDQPHRLWIRWPGLSPPRPGPVSQLHAEPAGLGLSQVSGGCGQCQCSVVQIQQNWSTT